MFFKVLFMTIAIIAIVSVSGLFLAYEKYKDEIIFIDPVNGQTRIRLNENEKNRIKKILEPVINFIYREAAVHNPVGDVLPDQIDDDIKQNIKDRL